jgi:hypothetical protein
LIPEVGTFNYAILQNLDQDGLWRSGKFAFSGNFSNFIDFLNDHIPEDAVVVIPPEEVSPWELSDSPTMQFFLAPREIRNCKEVSCGASFIGKDNTYIIVMGEETFPGSRIFDQAENIRMYNDTWGVYGEFSEPELIPDSQNTGNLINRLAVIVLQILASVLFILLAFMVGDFLLPNNSVWANLGIGFGLLSGIYSFAGFLFMYFDLIQSPRILLFLFAGLTAILVVSILVKNKDRIKRLKELITFRFQTDFCLIIIILLGLGFSFFSIGSGFAGSDAYVLWGPKAIGLIEDGLPGVVNRGTNATIYPLHIPILLAMFLDAFGNFLPLAKVIFPLFYFSLLLMMYEFLKGRFGNHLSGLSTVVFGTLPLIARHARLGYANLPLTYYLTISVILLLNGLSKRGGSKGTFFLLSGIFLAFSIWTRPEGTYLVLIIIIIGIVQLIRSSEGQMGSYLRLIIPPLLMVLTWEMTSNQFYTGVSQAESGFSGFLRSISQGEFQLKNVSAILGYLMQELVNFQTWGVIGAGLIMAVILGIKKRYSFSIQSSTLAIAAISSVTLIIGIYYLLPFYFNPDVAWWLRSGFNRMIMPSIALLWLGIVWVINSTATAGEQSES